MCCMLRTLCGFLTCGFLKDCVSSSSSCSCTFYNTAAVTKKPDPEVITLRAAFFWFLVFSTMENPAFLLICLFININMNRSLKEHFPPIYQACRMTAYAFFCMLAWTSPPRSSCLERVLGGASLTLWSGSWRLVDHHSPSDPSTVMPVPLLAPALYHPAVRSNSMSPPQMERVPQPRCLSMHQEERSSLTSLCLTRCVSRLYHPSPCPCGVWGDGSELRLLPTTESD